MKDVTYSATNVRRIELVLGETLSAVGRENTEPEGCKPYKVYFSCGKICSHIYSKIMNDVILQAYISYYPYYFFIYFFLIFLFGIS